MILNNRLPQYSINIDNCCQGKVIHKVKSGISDDVLYSILNYDNKVMNVDDDYHGIYRSVILQYPELTVLGYSPPKSLSYAYFTQKNKIGTDIEESELIVNELVEGIMITLFYDFRISKWEIATKGSVGGDCCYYNSQTTDKKERKTFKAMFLDAIQADDLQSAKLIDGLPKWASYTFILQHPENHILLRKSQPAAYIIAVYRIYSNMIEFISPDTYESWKNFTDGICKIPKRYDNSVINDPSKIFDSECEIVKGLVITNPYNGSHYSKINPNYISLNETRNINPNIQYLYFCLRRVKRAFEYLTYYPDYKKDFLKIGEEYLSFVNNVYNAYVSFYINKKTDISEHHLFYAHKIHRELYIPMMANQRIEKQKKKWNMSNAYDKARPKITFISVLDYFDSKSPRELLYIMSWRRRNFL